MAVSTVASWTASRSTAVMVAGAELGGVVVGAFEAGGMVVVAALSGAADVLLTSDLPMLEHAATSRPAARRAMGRRTWRRSR